jgi:hypothetical protein
VEKDKFLHVHHDSPGMTEYSWISISNRVWNHEEIDKVEILLADTDGETSAPGYLIKLVHFIDHCKSNGTLRGSIMVVPSVREDADTPIELDFTEARQLRNV